MDTRGDTEHQDDSGTRIFHAELRVGCKLQADQPPARTGLSRDPTRAPC